MNNVDRFCLVGDKAENEAAENRGHCFGHRLAEAGESNLFPQVFIKKS